MRGLIIVQIEKNSFNLYQGLNSLGLPRQQKAWWQHWHLVQVWPHYTHHFKVPFLQELNSSAHSYKCPAADCPGTTPSKAHIPKDSFCFIFKIKEPWKQNILHWVAVFGVPLAAYHMDQRTATLELLTISLHFQLLTWNASPLSPL